jgi:hypothetical protein
MGHAARGHGRTPPAPSTSLLGSASCSVQGSGFLTSSMYRGVPDLRQAPGLDVSHSPASRLPGSHTCCRPSPAEMFTRRASPRLCQLLAMAPRCSEKQRTLDSALGLRSCAADMLYRIDRGIEQCSKEAEVRLVGQDAVSSSCINFSTRVDRVRAKMLAYHRKLVPDGSHSF